MHWCISYSRVRSCAFVFVCVRPCAFVFAFAADVRSLRAMRKTKPTPSPDLPTAPAREAVRTPLFWLLYDNHARLSENWAGNRVKWATVCAWAAAHGVPDQPPNAVRMTWARVCAEKAHERAKWEAKPRPVHLRSPAVNQPPAVAVPVTNPPNRSHPAPAQTNPGEEFDVEQHLADIRATIAHRSGRS